MTSPWRDRFARGRDARPLALHQDRGSGSFGTCSSEYITDFAATIALGAPLEEDARVLAAAFHDPAYALTLGTSNDLVKILHVGDAAEADEHTHADFENAGPVGRQNGAIRSGDGSSGNARLLHHPVTPGVPPAH